MAAVGELESRIDVTAGASMMSLGGIVRIVWMEEQEAIHGWVSKIPGDQI